MARPDEVARLIKQGLTPGQVAQQWDRNIKTVLGYIDRAIGEGLITRSEVFFNIEKASDEKLGLWDRSLYEAYLHNRVAWGDLYGLLADLEKGLHERIHTTLVEHFGEADWWPHGVADDIRADCDQRRSASREQTLLHPYYYTTLRNLIDIITDQSAVFQEALPSSLPSDVGNLLDRLHRANRIRNRTMHPVRSEPPTQEECDFVHKLRDDLLHSAWSLSTPQYIRERHGELTVLSRSSHPANDD